MTKKLRQKLRISLRKPHRPRAIRRLKVALINKIASYQMITHS